jgi:hypothetical protein
VKNEGVANEQELGNDWVVTLDEAWRVVEADQGRLDNLERAFCYDQYTEDREARKTTDNPVEDGHVRRSWQDGGRMYIACIWA